MHNNQLILKWSAILLKIDLKINLDNRRCLGKRMDNF